MIHVCISSALVTYIYLLGFESAVEKFFFYMLTLALLSSTASAMAFAISARAPVTTVGIVGTAVSFILQIVCL